ncbi:MAG: hypothetical protein M3N97_01365 [Pseudomonadota bacterium]|nr:hypothetical protein [Pseudomonadota bacterium]
MRSPTNWWSPCFYRGTNPDHHFTLQWSECRTGDSGLPGVAAEVLDDQFKDRALQDFRKTQRFSLGGIPCRPAKVTFRTAPRFYVTLTIP